MKKASRQPNGLLLVSTMHVTGSGRSFLTCTLGSAILVSEEIREVSDQAANGDWTYYACFVSLSREN